MKIQKKYLTRAKRLAPAVLATALVAGGVAGAEDAATVPTFSFPVGTVVTAVGGAIVAIATAGAGLRGLGIAIKAGFKWASALLKG